MNPTHIPKDQYTRQYVIVSCFRLINKVLNFCKPIARGPIAEKFILITKNIENIRIFTLIDMISCGKLRLHCAVGIDTVRPVVFLSSEVLKCVRHDFQSCLVLAVLGNVLDRKSDCFRLGLIKCFIDNNTCRRQTKW